MALAMRCNCQMSFSSSLERPRFKLRSQRKRIDSTKTIGRPRARVARTTVTSSESRGVEDCGMVPPKASLGPRIPQRDSAEKRMRAAQVMLHAALADSNGNDADGAISSPNTPHTDTSFRTESAE